MFDLPPQVVHLVHEDGTRTPAPPQTAVIPDACPHCHVPVDKSVL